jgi:hypothetical protein
LIRHQPEAAKCNCSAMSAVCWPQTPLTVSSQISSLHLVTAATHLLVLISAKIVQLQDRQHTYNLTLLRVRVTTGVMEMK